MQSRFWISTHNEFEAALNAKKIITQQFPDRVYQIRKGTEGSRIVFRLVQRLPRNEAEVVNQSKQAQLYQRRRNKGWRARKNNAPILY